MIVEHRDPKPIKYIKVRWFTTLLLFLILCLFSACTASPAAAPIRFYQKCISPIDGHRCRMYPSCSEYSRQAIEKHGPLVGWILTCDRLMRCGRSEIKLSDEREIGRNIYCYDPLSNNDFWWHKKKTQP